jgi:hypothetical protein
MTETSYLSELLLRWEELRQQGRDVMAGELCIDHPELAASLQERIDAMKKVKGVISTGRSLEGPGAHKRTDTGAGARLGLCMGAEPVPGYRLIQKGGHGLHRRRGVYSSLRFARGVPGPGEPFL